MTKRKQKIKPGGKPVKDKETKERKEKEEKEDRVRFKRVLEARMMNTEDSDLNRTTKSPDLPKTEPPDLFGEY